VDVEVDVEEKQALAEGKFVLGKFTKKHFLF